MNIKEIVSKEIKIDGITEQEVEKLLLVPPQKEMGDLSLPCFSLAKIFHKSPTDIAVNLKQSLEGNKKVRAEVLNGYLNLFLNEQYFSEEIIKDAEKNLENYGMQNIGKDKLCLIEYSSINVAKNPHVGHLCGTVYGESFCRLHEYFGYNVKRLNYLGDYGTQFGKVITAYKKYGSREKVLERGVDELQDLYIKVNAECETNEELLTECRECFLKLERGDKEIKELYDWFKEISIEEAKRIYNELDISFDDWRGESYYAQFNKETLETLNKKGLTKRDKGALLVDLTEYNLGKLIVEQTSGASIYATRDLSSLVNRYNEYKYDKLLYVTGVEQEQYFNQVFQVGRLMGLDYMDKVFHFSTGRISLPTGKISSRKGAVALIRDLFKASQDKAHNVLLEKGTNASDIDVLEKQIGIGALVFTILKSTSTKDSVFDLDKAISFDGETGPYLQYTYARTCSILKKAEEMGINPKLDAKILPKETFALIKLFPRFKDAINNAFCEYDPSYIARYSMNLCSEFNRLYSEMKILSDDKVLSQNLLLLTKITNNLLKKCLYFLVMKAPERM